MTVGQQVGTLYNTLETIFARLLVEAWYWLPRLIVVVLLLLVTRVAMNWATRALQRLLGPSDLAPELVGLLVRAGRITVVVLGVLGVMGVLGLDEVAYSFLAGLGISGLIIAFALQEIAKNFAAGLLLLFHRPFSVGDRIRVGDHEGLVTDLGLRVLSLRTDDNREILVPNAQVYTGIITNLTRYSARRYSLTLKLVSSAPIEQAVAAIQAQALEVLGVQPDPAPEVLVTDASGPISIEIRYWLPARNFDAALISSQLAQRLRELGSARGWLST